MAIDLTAIGAAAGFLTARHAGGSFTIGGLDIFSGLASQSVLSFSYTDNTSDMADDLSVEIADPHRTWMQSFLPKKGVEGTGAIKVYNWLIPGDTRKIDCGVFWLDQIEFKGPPNTVSIKATSVPVTTGLKNEKRYHSWENMDLKTIFQELATKNGLALVWDTKKTMPKLERVDQADTPDLEFIRDKAKDNSLSIKIYKKQLVIYSEEEYEARPPAYVIIYGAANILNYSFSSKLDDTYKDAKNAYVDPDTGSITESHVEPEESPEGSGSTLQINEGSDDHSESGAGEESGGEGGGGMLREGDGFVDYTTGSPASSQTASDDKTKSKLREKNKKEKESSIMVIGNPDYLSGLNVQLVGFGVFDGKWFISSSVHNISSAGYVTELKMRGALSGY